MAVASKSAAPWRRRMKFPFDTLTRDIQRDPPPHPAHHCRRLLGCPTAPHISKTGLEKEPKKQPPKNYHFSQNEVPKGCPKEPKSHQKSSQALPGTPLERTSFNEREKGRRRTLLGSCPCASRTVNTMVFAHSTMFMETAFWIDLALLLAPFFGPWAP